MTNSNKVIVFLKYEFPGGSFKRIFSNIIFSSKGFVLFDESDCPFNCIKFESDALNTFYLPIQLADRKALLDEKNCRNHIRNMIWELQCLVAIELKIDDFKAEYLGKMEFYLEALDRDVSKEILQKKLEELSEAADEAQNSQRCREF